MLFIFFPCNIASFSAYPNEINLGDSSKLSWKVEGANSVEIDQGIGSVSNEDLRKISPLETTVYTISANNIFGRNQKQITVTVIPSKPVINYFYAEPESINEGDSSTLNWDVSDAKRVSIDHEIGEVSAIEQEKLQPSTTTTYTLTASNDAGSTDKQVKIEVNTDANPSASDLIKQGDAYRYMEKDGDAENAYKKAIELDPTNVQAWTDLSFVQNRQGNSDQALLAAENAINFDPTYESAWNTKGNALAKLERFDEAIQAYNKVIELNSTNSNAWYNKGRILCKQKMYNESIQAYDEAIKIDPQFARAYYDKGIDLELAGLTTEADAAYAKAKELGYTG